MLVTPVHKTDSDDKLRAISDGSLHGICDGHDRLNFIVSSTSFSWRLSSSQVFSFSDSVHPE